MTHDVLRLKGTRTRYCDKERRADIPLNPPSRTVEIVPTAKSQTCAPLKRQ
ncbi:hypothetical protein HJC23_013758 [Cyclotella cryptica]|uniref:Uncharacterized protein n=1 Tax=Cyclotella cryptica TaxID=29204 RepID=A0ABD3NNQ0_9STRA